MEKHLYEGIWQSKLNEIRSILSLTSSSGSISFSKNNFESVGNRVKSRYRFTLIIDNNKITNNISNSAVARDLGRVIQRDLEMKRLLVDKRVAFELDEDFILHIIQG